MIPPHRKTIVYIHDVAREAGCSISTVSKVMNGSGAISENTRKRIQEIADRLGYAPQAAARMLKNQRTENVGLIFYQSTDRLFSNPFYSIVIAGVEEVLTEANYNLLLGRGQASRPDWEFPKFLRERFVDGLLLLGNIHESSVRRVSDSGVPFILMDHDTEDETPPADCFESDGHAGAMAAVDYLVSKGHRQIAMLTTDVENPSTEARLSGYREALSRHGLIVPDDGIIRAPHDEQGGEEAAKSLLRKTHQATAVFCVNDAMAMGAARHFAAAGLRIPDEISLIGFDDIATAEMMSPPLTTIRVDMKEMGRRAAEHLLEQMRGKSSPPQRHILPVRLIERGSVSPRTA